MKNLRMMSWDQLEMETNAAMKRCVREGRDALQDSQFREAMSEALDRVEGEGHALCMHLPGLGTLHIDPVNVEALLNGTTEKQKKPTGRCAADWHFFFVKSHRN